MCSRLPVIRRPRGPRKVRSTPETNPEVTRSPRPPGLDSAKTGVPMSAAAADGHARAGASPVATSMMARSPSMSRPATLPSAVVPSAKVTTTWSPRTLCALVSTRPAPSTMPEPTPQRCPMPTTEGPALSASCLMFWCISSRIVMGTRLH